MFVYWISLEIILFWIVSLAMALWGPRIRMLGDILCFSLNWYLKIFFKKTHSDLCMCFKISPYSNTAELFFSLSVWLFVLHTELVGCHTFQEEQVVLWRLGKSSYMCLNNPVDLKSMRNVHSSSAFHSSFQNLYHWD